MRLNQPITDREIDFPADEPLVSRTDPGGRITFVNRAFIGVSGFTQDELIGAPHDLVRHLHMPKEAFADLWTTLKAGRPWEGLVKNRTRAGDFYWVRANATPVVENGKVTGYISIRAKPSRDQVAEAEAAYAKLLAETAKGIGLRDGQIVRRGLLANVADAWASLTGRLAVAFGSVVLAMMLVGGLGLQGMGNSNVALRNVEERTVRTGQIAEILDILQRNLRLATQLAVENSAVQERIAEIRANSARTEVVMQSIRSGQLLPEEDALISRYTAQRARRAEEGLRPAIAFAAQGDIPALRAHVLTKLLPN